MEIMDLHLACKIFVHIGILIYFDYLDGNILIKGMEQFNKYFIEASYVAV